MDRCLRKRPKTATSESDEVISDEWEFINMTEQEEDLLYRMYRLVGPSYCKTRYLKQLCFKSRETIHPARILQLESGDVGFNSWSDSRSKTRRIREILDHETL